MVGWDGTLVEREGWGEKGREEGGGKREEEKGGEGGKSA